MKKFGPLILAAVMIGSVLTPSAPAAESFSVLLQKGIFAEETEGNLDAAIKIYQQITAEAAANRSVVAQAQYRLGVCYQKKGNKEQAISILNDLLKQFPAEAALGQKARELLAGLGQTPSSSITIRKLPLIAEVIYSVSPDGRLVAYRPKENNNIVIYETATGKTWTAAKGGTGWGFWYAHISPDGRQIAYGKSQLYVAKIDGSEAKQVYEGKKGSEGNKDAEIWGIAWSPDGGQLIVNSYEEKISIVCALDIKTGTMKEIKRMTSSLSLEHVFLSWSGRYLAYASYRAAGGSYSPWKISVLDLESATETTLIEKEIGEVVGWSPEDAKLLFLSKRTGTTGLWAIPVREGKPSGDPELVKANVGANSNFRNYYGLTREGSFYCPEAELSEHVYRATANFQTGEISGQPRRVTDRFLGVQYRPVWSKDGQKLMLAVHGEQKRFVAVSLAAGEQKDYPVSDTFLGARPQYAWSPDGAFLLVLSVRAEVGLGIHRYALATGTTEMLVKRMTEPAANWICFPRFAPDGNSFFYTRRDFFKGADEREDWKDSIVRRNLQSGKEEVVYESPEKLQIWCPYELSLDGERLAIVTSDQFRTNDFVVAIKVRGVSGSETKEVVRMAPRENVTSLAWTPDGKRLVYTKELPPKNQGADRPTEVWATAVDSGQSVELKFSQPGICDISIHPDGRQIAFRAGLSSGQDLWVMEGLMPKPTTQSAGMVIRRVLADASGVDGVLTADGKYICHIDGDTGDMVQFEVASGQTSVASLARPV